MARHSKDHIEILHDYGLHLATRTVFLESSSNDEGEENGVNYFMAMRFLKNFYLLETTNKEPITVILNTTGGDISQGMAIYDEIKNSKCHVTMRVKGNALSMGSIILQAADERVLQSHSQVMFHLGTPDTFGNNIHEVINQAKAELEFGNKIDDILYARISEKFTKENKAFTRGKFNDLNFKGKYMTAEEAVDMGLADRIETP